MLGSSYKVSVAIGSRSHAFLIRWDRSYDPTVVQCRQTVARAVRDFISFSLFYTIDNVSTSSVRGGCCQTFFFVLFSLFSKTTSGIGHRVK